MTTAVKPNNPTISLRKTNPPAKIAGGTSAPPQGPINPPINQKPKLLASETPPKPTNPRQGQSVNVSAMGRTMHPSPTQGRRQTQGQAAESEDPFGFGDGDYNEPVQNQPNRKRREGGGIKDQQGGQRWGQAQGGRGRGRGGGGGGGSQRGRGSARGGRGRGGRGRGQGFAQHQQQQQMYDEETGEYYEGGGQMEEVKKFVYQAPALDSTAPEDTLRFFLPPKTFAKYFSGIYIKKKIYEGKRTRVYIGFSDGVNTMRNLDFEIQGYARMGMVLAFDKKNNKPYYRTQSPCEGDIKLMNAIHEKMIDSQIQNNEEFKAMIYQFYGMNTKITVNSWCDKKLGFDPCKFFTIPEDDGKYFLLKKHPLGEKRPDGKIKIVKVPLTSFKDFDRECRGLGGSYIYRGRISHYDLTYLATNPDNQEGVLKMSPITYIWQVGMMKEDQNYDKYDQFSCYDVAHESQPGEESGVNPHPENTVDLEGKQFNDDIKKLQQFQALTRDEEEKKVGAVAAAGAAGAESVPSAAGAASAASTAPEDDKKKTTKEVIRPVTPIEPEEEQKDLKESGGRSEATPERAAKKLKLKGNVVKDDGEVTESTEADVDVFSVGAVGAVGVGEIGGEGGEAGEAGEGDVGDFSSTGEAEEKQTGGDYEEAPFEVEA